jgi:hypothetical protein
MPSGDCLSHTLHQSREREMKKGEVTDANYYRHSKKNVKIWSNLEKTFVFGLND